MVLLYHIIYLLTYSFYTKSICPYFKVPMHPLANSHLLLIAISPQNITQNRKYFFMQIFSTPALIKRQNLFKTHAHTKMCAQIVLSFYRKIRLRLSQAWLSKTFYDILNDRIKQEILRSFQLHLLQNLVKMHGCKFCK